MVKLHRFKTFFRVQDRYPETPGAAYAHFAEASLNHQTSRRREMVPSIVEIVAVLELRDLMTVINCYGNATCEIGINSFTTSGKVSCEIREGNQQIGLEKQVCAGSGNTRK